MSMSKGMRKIMYEACVVIIAALLVGTEYVLAATWGYTIDGVPYAEYSLNYMAAHPILTCIFAGIFGYCVNELGRLLSEF